MEDWRKLISIPASEFRFYECIMAMAYVNVEELSQRKVEMVKKVNSDKLAVEEPPVSVFGGTASSLEVVRRYLY